MSIDNPGTSSVHHGVKAITANSISQGIDVFTSASPPPSGTQMTWGDGTDVTWGDGTDVTWSN